MAKKVPDPDEAGVNDPTVKALRAKRIELLAEQDRIEKARGVRPVDAVDAAVKSYADLTNRAEEIRVATPLADREALDIKAVAIAKALQQNARDTECAVIRASAPVWREARPGHEAILARIIEGTESAKAAMLEEISYLSDTKKRAGFRERSPIVERHTGLIGFCDAIIRAAASQY